MLSLQKSKVFYFSIVIIVRLHLPVSQRTSFYLLMHLSLWIGLRLSTLLGVAIGYLFGLESDWLEVATMSDCFLGGRVIK